MVITSCFPFTLDTGSFHGWLLLGYMRDRVATLLGQKFMEEEDEMRCLARIIDRIGGCPATVRDAHECAALSLPKAAHQVATLPKRGYSNRAWAELPGHGVLEQTIRWDPAERAALATVLQDDWYLAEVVKELPRPRRRAGPLSSLFSLTPANACPVAAATRPKPCTLSEESAHADVVMEYFELAWCRIHPLVPLGIISRALGRPKGQSQYISTLDFVRHMFCFGVASSKHMSGA